MKNILPLTKKELEEEKQTVQKAKIIKFPEIQAMETAESIESSSSKSPKVKITTHYLYYRGKKIPISRFEKAGYGKLLRLLVKEIS